MVRILSLLLLSFAILTFGLKGAGQAQSPAMPEPPAPVQTLVDEGAEIRYLGNQRGFDAWVTLKGGQEQYFYAPQNGDGAFVMGLLFDEDGKLITVDQVNALRGAGDPLLDELADGASALRAQREDSGPNAAFQSPAEQLFADVEAANWVPMGQAGAPVLYSFIDPQCPHCHDFIKDVLAANLLNEGRLQIRMIPVGFREDTLAQAAFLIATPNPQERFISYLDGDEDALPVRPEINQQGVQKNLAVMQTWQLDATPLSVYRSAAGQVKIIRGRPQSLDVLLNDLGS